MQAVLTNPRTVLKALELCARLNGELDSPHRVSLLKRPGPRVASLGVDEPPNGPQGPELYRCTE